MLQALTEQKIKKKDKRKDGELCEPGNDVVYGMKIIFIRAQTPWTGSVRTR